MSVEKLPNDSRSATDSAHAPWLKPVLLSLIGLSLLWFGSALLYEAYYKPLLYDDAYNASVAKNFINGLGWSSSYHYVWPFDPRVSSGPTLLLPAAVAIGLLGTPLWLPAMVTSTLMLLLLLISLAASHRLFLTLSDFTIYLLSLLVLFSVYDRNLWGTLIADGVIALIILIMSAVAAKGFESKQLIIIGLLAALAFLAKLYALIPLAGVCGYLLLQWVDKRQEWSHAPTLLIQYGKAGLIAALCVLPWQWYKHISMSGMSQALLENHEIVAENFFRFYGSGVGQWLQAESTLGFMGENAERNFASLSQFLSQYGSGNLLSILLIIIVIAATANTLWRKRTPLDNFILCTSLAALAHFGWYLLINPSIWIHYSRIAVLLSLVVCCAWMVRLGLGKAWLGLCLLIAFTQPQESANQWRKLLAFDQEVSPITQDHLALMQHIEHSDNELPYAGCGWAVPRHLEYAMPGSNHFLDCQLLLQEQLSTDLRKLNGLESAQRDSTGIDLLYDRERLLSLIDGPVQLSEPVRFKLVYLNWLYGWLPEQDIELVRSLCDLKLYDTEPSTIYLCEISEIPPKLARKLIRYRPNLK